MNENPPTDRIDDTVSDSADGASDYPWRNQPSDEPDQNPESQQQATSPTHREQNTEPVPTETSPTTHDQAEHLPPEELTDGQPHTAAGDYSTNNSDEVDASIPVRILLFVVGLGSRIFHMKILGLHWIIPRITGTTKHNEALTGYFYPDDMLMAEEEVLYSGNPSRWTSFVPYLVAYILLGLSIFVAIMVPLGYGEALLDAVTPAFMDLAVPEEWWYAPILFFLLGVALLLRQALYRTSTWHLVTDQRVLTRENIIATDRNRLRLHEVNNVKDNIPFGIERAVGVGNIEISSAASGGTEMVFYGVKHPGRVTDLIDDLMHQRKAHFNNPAVGTPPDNGPQQSENHDRSNTQRDTQSHAHQTERSHDQGHSQQPRDDPRGQRHEQPRGNHPQADPGAHEPSDHRSSSGRGDSIEEQRPGNTLRDDL